MRKPTAIEFFLMEAIVWLFILTMVGVYHNWTPRSALSVFFLKVSVVNVSVAAFNTIGACISMATGFCPWRDRTDTGSVT